MRYARRFERGCASADVNLKKLGRKEVFEFDWQWKVNSGDFNLARTRPHNVDCFRDAKRGSSIIV